MWAVGLVITASFLASAATSMVGGTAQLGPAAGGAAMATGAGTQAEGRNLYPNGYFVDALFRSDHPVPDGNDDGSMRAEVSRILANGLRQKDVPAADKTYLAQLVAARTGLTQSDAEKRVL